MNEKQVNINEQEICLKVMDKLRNDGYIGLDPSALRFSKNLLKIRNTVNRIFPSNIGEKIIYKFLYYSGHRINNLLKPEKNIYAKGLGLNLLTYSNLYKSNIITYQEFKSYTDEIVQLLNNKKIENLNLWAHEVNYYIQGKLITTDTPNLITTAFVALGIYSCAEVTGKEIYFSQFKSIIEDMLEIFPFIKYKDSGCFMYTPITNYHVHNANLLMCELLCMYQQVNYKDEIHDLIISSLKYSINDFNETKSFYYAGLPTRNKTIDNYHTGFVLRSMKRIHEYLFQNNTDDTLLKELKGTIKYGIEFYFSNFITDKYIIRDHLNTLESHSLAEAILIYKYFKKFFNNDFVLKYENSISHTFQELWNEDKHYFYYTVRFLPGGIKLKDKTNMVRWSQSWIAYALSQSDEDEDDDKL